MVFLDQYELPHIFLNLDLWDITANVALLALDFLLDELDTCSCATRFVINWVGATGCSLLMITVANVVLV